MKFYVILWRYADRSGNGVVKVFTDKEEAEALLAILVDHGCMDKVFEISEVESK